MLANRVQGQEIDMAARGRSLFQVDAAALQGFVGLGLDGRAASSFLTVHTEGVRVASQGISHPLLSCGQKHSAGLELHHVQRFIHPPPPPFSPISPS